MAATVVSQNLKVLRQIRDLGRPHRVVGANGMGQHDYRKAIIAFQTIEDASLVRSNEWHEG